MVVAWLLFSTFPSIRRKPIWPWLFVCAAILAIKRPGFTAEFWVLLSALLMIGLVDFRQGINRADRKSVRLFTFVWVSILAATIVNFELTRWFGKTASEALELDSRPIACLGDSLTDYGYPQELEKLISVPVADFGVSGIKTDDGIKMLPDIIEADPQLVVIELGGHDYNADKKTRAETKKI